jgi:hypothetical protein
MTAARWTFLRLHRQNFLSRRLDLCCEKRLCDLNSWQFLVANLGLKCAMMAAAEFKPNCLVIRNLIWFRLISFL